MEVTTRLYKPQLLPANFQCAYCAQDEAFHNRSFDRCPSFRWICSGWRSLRHNGTPDLVASYPDGILSGHQGNLGPTDFEREHNRRFPLHAWPRGTVHAIAEYQIRLQTTQRLPSTHTRYAYRTPRGILLKFTHERQDRRLRETGHQ